jgi:hypothetical protein
VLDNRRGAFPFRGVWYYPHPDHASDAFVSMSLAGARSENLASVWLLAHLTDQLNDEQLRRLAALVGLAPTPGEGPAFATRLRDQDALRSSPERFEEYAFTAARRDVLSGLAFGAHPEDAAEVRSLAHGQGFAAERARVLKSAPSDERTARLAALDANFIGLEEAARACVAEARLVDVEGQLRCGGEGTPFAGEVTDETDFLVAGRIHRSTLTALRTAVNSHLATLQGRDPWDPEVLALNPDYRTLVGLRYLTRMVAALGVDAKLPEVLSLPLGAADLTLLQAAQLYQGMLAGQRWSLLGQGYEDGAVPGLRSTFDLPDAGPDVTLIAEIRDSAGNVLYRAQPRAETVLDARSGELVGDILRNVVRLGTGRRAADAVKVGGFSLPLAGKTGTTNDYRNAAFMGFAPVARDGRYRWGDGLTVGAYVGYDDNTSMRRGGYRVQGANGALPVWIATVEGLSKAGLLGGAGGSEYVHEGLTVVPVQPGTGLPRGDGTDGPGTLVGERRFAPFTEDPSAAEALTPPAPPPAPGPVAEPGLVEEGLPEPTEGSVWDGL